MEKTEPAPHSPHAPHNPLQILVLYTEQRAMCVGAFTEQSTGAVAGAMQPGETALLKC